MVRSDRGGGTERADFQDGYHRSDLCAGRLIEVVFEIWSPNMSKVTRRRYVIMPDMTP